MRRFFDEFFLYSSQFFIFIDINAAHNAGGGRHKARVPCHHNLLPDRPDLPPHRAGPQADAADTLLAHHAGRLHPRPTARGEVRRHGHGELVHLVRRPLRRPLPGGRPSSRGSWFKRAGSSSSRWAPYSSSSSSISTST